MKKISNFLKHPLFSGSAIMVGGSMTVNIVNYVYHLVFGRVLGPEDYGTLASIYSLLYIVTIVPTSASIAIVKFISSARNIKDKAEVYHSINKFMQLVGIISLLFIILLSSSVSAFLHIKEVTNVLLVAPIVFLTLLALVNQSTSQGILNFSGFVIPNLISAISKFLFGIVFIYVGWRVGGAVLGILVAVGFAYISSIYFVRDLAKIKARNSFRLKSFIKYSFPVLVQAVAFTSFFTTDVLLVKHFFSSFDAGLYAALSTLGKIIFFAATPIASTMFPIISGRRTRGESYTKVFYMSLAITVLLSLGATFIYWIFPGVVIEILYGGRYLSASPNLVWMGLFISIYTISYLLVNFSLSIGITKTVIFPLLGSIVQAFGIWFFHDSLFQVIEISLITSIVVCFGLFVYLRYNRLAFIYEK